MNTSTVLVRALLAYSVHEHQAGTATQLHLTLRSRSCTVQDNGRGMGLDRDGYVVGLLEQLAARRSEVALHGIGLAILAMSSPFLQIESRRNGRLFTQAFAWGVAQGPVHDELAPGATGTRLMFTLPSEAPEIDCDEVLAQVETWRTAHPGLKIDVVFPELALQHNDRRRSRMTRRLISSGSTFEAQIGYSRAVVAGDFVFVSGTTGFDYAAMTISDSLVEQTEQCLRNIEAALREADASFGDVVRVTYVLPEATAFEQCWPVLRKYFGDVRPAATMISAGLADPRMKIEIEVTALRRGRQATASASAIQVCDIDHVVLRVVSIDAMLAFYCDVLGCTVERRQEALGLVQLRAGRSLVDLVPVDGKLGRAGGAAPGREGRNMDHFCLRVEPFDEAAIRRQLQAHGVQAGATEQRFGAQGEGPSIYVTDPEGNVIELKGPPG